MCAARYAEEHGKSPTPECANCGVRQGAQRYAGGGPEGGACVALLRCGRCRSEWFCSLSCHKAFWPLHRPTCRANEFADAVEGQDPKFAAFLRRHGKQAVLQDGEVERLERAGRAVGGPAREEVMGSMYGRFDPRPLGPYYSAEERAAMSAAALTSSPMDVARAHQALLQAGAADADAHAHTGAGSGVSLALPGGGQQQQVLLEAWCPVQERAWRGIELPQGMGMECDRYKWRQNLSHVELFWRLPQGVAPRQVQVKLRVQQLCVSVGGGQGCEPGPVLQGKLYAPVQLDASTWFVVDGVLQVLLLKGRRKGRYGPGATAADTWWRSVWADADCPPGEALTGSYPPVGYYSCQYEEDDLDTPPVVAAAATRKLGGGAARGAVLGTGGDVGGAAGGRQPAAADGGVS